MSQEPINIRQGRLVGVALARTENNEPVVVVQCADNDGAFIANITSSEVLVEFVKTISAGSVSLAFVVSNSDPTVGISLVVPGEIENLEAAARAEVELPKEFELLEKNEVDTITLTPDEAKRIVEAMGYKK